MPKRVLPLTSVRIANAKTRPARYRLYDGNGLYLEITPTGSKLWYVKYRFNNKNASQALGPYPLVSLVDARAKRDEIRKKLLDNIDPKQAKIETETFETMARTWHAAFKGDWTDKYASFIIDALEKEAFPLLGSLPVDEITPPLILVCLKKTQERGALNIAHRIHNFIKAVFRFAIAHGKVTSNPAVDIAGVLPSAKGGHRAALTEPADVARLLKAIDNYSGSIFTRYVLQLAPLVFVRPGELVNMEWSEVDLNEALWTIPADKMKMKIGHVVPLSVQAVALLTEVKRLSGQVRYVFPSYRSFHEPIVVSSLNKALNRMGFGTDIHTAHGFRAMARTMLDEILEVRPDIIEHQLAHVVRDPLGRAYNRTKFLPQRREMMQQWADYLDSLKNKP